MKQFVHNRAKNIHDLLRIIFSRDNVEFSGLGAEYQTETARISVFFSIVSLVLTVLNVVKHYQLMAVATTILTIGFLAAALLAKRKKTEAARVIIALLCAFIFSAFAITGGNYGFAILWIILIPVISYMLIGIRNGFLLSLYFQLFLIVLFYTPLSGFVQDYYTSTFIMRFPLLYCASFIAVTMMMCQRQKLYNEVNLQAYRDAMTGLYNRRRYNEIRDEDKNGSVKNATVLSFDLNRLKYYNDTVGHEAGDEMIGCVADLLRGSFPQDLCFRIGGDEFSVVSTRPSEDVRKSVASFRSAAQAWKGRLVPSISISVGCAYADEHSGEDFESLCRFADQEMYAEKDRFYRESGFDRRTNRSSR